MAGEVSQKPPRRDEPGEILSPPYPRDDDDPAKLHTRLTDLQDWLNYYREHSNKYKGKKDCIPKARPVPGLERHLKLPLRRMHVLVMQMRSLRMGWDYLVALYEEEWTSGRSQDHRHSLLHYGQTVLDCAYLSDEMLEARKDHHERQCMQALAGHLQKFMLRIDLDPYHEGEKEGGPDEEGPHDPASS